MNDAQAGISANYFMRIYMGNREQSMRHIKRRQLRPYHSPSVDVNCIETLQLKEMAMLYGRVAKYN